ncbi:MAG: hypothetical protein ACREEP_06960 [Dongiaceae bacterium]
MSDIPSDWTAAAVRITPGFEVAGDPYLGVSGDFDGMGISCGALQWNIGQGSLQPMIKKVGKAHVTATMPTLGEGLWAACNGSVVAGLKVVRGWQNGAKLKPEAKAELRAFMGSPEMRAQQNERIDRKAATAFALASQWAANLPGGTPSKRSFCWFFDIVTQNGSLEDVTFNEVTEFLEQNKPDKADDLICDFLGGQTGDSSHVKDARKNADLWRNKADGAKLELLVMSYLRSKTASPKWRHVVLNRKGTIAMGSGWVNSTKHDFSAHGL